MNSLATLFFVLSLACYIQARLSQNHGAGRGKVILWFTGCGLTAAAGLASKEIVAVLPLMIFLYEWFFLKNLNRAWLKRQSGRASLMVVLLIAIALVYLGDTPLERLLLMYKNRGFSPAQRMLTEPQVVIYYMALLAFPHPARLNLDYDFPLVLSPISPGTALPAMMALTALAVAAGYAAKRHRLLSFAIFWFLGTLFIESSFIGLDLIFEYRAYLPSIFPVIALTVLVFRHVRPRSAALVLLSAVIMVCSLWTWQRNGAWNSPVALWHECALKSPQQARPANNLGHAWWKGRRQPREALPWFQKAVSLNPGYYDALNNLGGVLMDLGRPDEAIPPLKRAIALAPGKPGAYANLGAALNATGRPEEAVASYLTSIRISDEEAVRNNLGTVLMERGDRENAIVQFNQAIRINPEFPDAHNNLGVAMMQAGRAREAVHYFQRALELNPAYAQAHANLGTALLQAGDLEQARRHLRQAVDLDPGLMTAMNTMASVLVMQKQYAAAAETLERLAGQFPQNPTIRYNLACAYALQNKRNEAVACLKQAVDLGYGNREHIRTDPDLANIRGTEYYQELFGEKP
jgi:tetratricopeptide (TPR) repeat protein